MILEEKPALQRRAAEGEGEAEGEAEGEGKGKGALRVVKIRAVVKATVRAETPHPRKRVDRTVVQRKHRQRLRISVLQFEMIY